MISKGFTRRLKRGEKAGGGVSWCFEILYTVLRVLKSDCRLIVLVISFFGVSCVVISAPYSSPKWR